MTALSQKAKKDLHYPFPDPPAAGQLCAVADGVYWIRMPLPFALNHINLWLLDDGDSWTLVDTSMDTPDMRKIWQGIFTDHCTDKPIKKIICTHMHPDHVGLAGWLVEQFSGELFMTRAEYLTCRVLAADTGQPAPPEGIDFFRRHNMSERFIDDYKKVFGGFGKVIYRMPQSYHRIRDGDGLCIGGRDWHIIGGNGHSPEHASLYCPELSVFITGDQVLPRISSHIGTYPTEPEADHLSDWLTSCADIQNRVPHDVLVLPAHNEPFYGLHERLGGLIDNHEKGLTRMCDILTTPRTANDEAIYSVLFKRKIDDSNRGMALSETLSHLNCLMTRGLVEQYEDDKGILWYKMKEGKEDKRI